MSDRRLSSGSDAIQDRLDRIVLLGIEPGQLIRNLGEGILARHLELLDPAPENRHVGGLGGLQCFEPARHVVQHFSGLGKIPDLLECPQTGAQLIKPGQSSFQRRILVPDQPEDLAGERLETFLGFALRGNKGIHPGGKIGLKHLELGDACIGLALAGIAGWGLIRGGSRCLGSTLTSDRPGPGEKKQQHCSNAKSSQSAEIKHVHHKGAPGINQD